MAQGVATRRGYEIDHAQTNQQLRVHKPPDIMKTTEHIRQKIAALVDEYATFALAPSPFNPGTTTVPPSGNVIGADELKNMVKASLDRWLTTVWIGVYPGLTHAMLDYKATRIETFLGVNF